MVLWGGPQQEDRAESAELLPGHADRHVPGQCDKSTSEISHHGRHRPHQSEAGQKHPPGPAGAPTARPPTASAGGERPAQSHAHLYLLINPYQ